jgi:hypothetical protein
MPAGQRSLLSRNLRTKCRRRWAEISLAEIRKSIGAWKKRLRLVCGQDGGHIDHLATSPA